MRNSRHRSAQDWLEQALHGRSPPWPTAGSAAEVLALSAYHGVDGLLYRKLRRHTAPDWPAELTRRLQLTTQRQAIFELAHRRELELLLATLAGAGVRPLLLKGTALAYEFYREPALRPRGDTDLLVADTALPAADAVLRRLGYRPVARRDPRPSNQRSYRKTAYGVRHVIDLHWRLANRRLFSERLNYNELAAAARPLPQLAAAALALAPEHALLFACIHRIVHHHASYNAAGVERLGGDRLIWLLDIRLLAAALDAAGWRRLTALAAERQLSGVCLDGLHAAAKVFADPAPAAATAALAAAAGTDSIKVSSLTGGYGRFLLAELRVLPGWQARWRWLRLTLSPARRGVLRRVGRALRHRHRLNREQTERNARAGR